MADTTYTVVKNKILTKLQALTGSGQKLQEVTDNPKLEFAGYPAAIIIPAEGESDWETNKEDDRIYAFDVIVYEETKAGGISRAIDSLMDAVDDVLDTFAEDKYLDGIASSMPAGKQLTRIEPVAAGWGDIPDKELIAATVKLRAHISVDNS